MSLGHIRDLKVNGFSPRKLYLYQGENTDKHRFEVAWRSNGTSEDTPALTLAPVINWQWGAWYLFIDLTSYSKLHFVVSQRTTGDTTFVGCFTQKPISSLDTNSLQGTSITNPNVGLNTIDISNINNWTYIGLFAKSSSKALSTLSVTEIYLEK